MGRLWPKKNTNCVRTQPSIGIRRRRRQVNILRKVVIIGMKSHIYIKRKMPSSSCNTSQDTFPGVSQACLCLNSFQQQPKPVELLFSGAGIYSSFDQYFAIFCHFITWQMRYLSNRVMKSGSAAPAHRVHLKRSLKRSPGRKMVLSSEIIV